MAKANDRRLAVLRTCKLFIGGAFPRSESGRCYHPQPDNVTLGNISLASRKDMRNAVVAARGAQPEWATRSAYNRGQILYRVAEMLEGRIEQFVAELQLQGAAAPAARREVELAIDCLVHYAGWCDKFQQVFSAVNPVASSHFNFSILEPTGVVFQFADPKTSLLGLVSLLAPVIASGNTLVALASESRPLAAITLAEVLATSDVPGGVVNLLTGYAEELAEPVARHRDINAIALDDQDRKLVASVQRLAADSVKRVRTYEQDWMKPEALSPYLIADFCETKTIWHPVEQISATGAGY